MQPKSNFKKRKRNARINSKLPTQWTHCRSCLIDSGYVFFYQILLGSCFDPNSVVINISEIELENTGSFMQSRLM